MYPLKSIIRLNDCLPIFLLLNQRTLVWSRCFTCWLVLQSCLNSTWSVRPYTRIQIISCFDVVYATLSFNRNISLLFISTWIVYISYHDFWLLCISVFICISFSHLFELLLFRSNFHELLMGCPSSRNNFSCYFYGSVSIWK